MYQTPFSLLFFFLEMTNKIEIIKITNKNTPTTEMVIICAGVNPVFSFSYKAVALIVYSVSPLSKE